MNDSGHETVHTEEVFAGLTALQQALSGHMEWLGRWYMAILKRIREGTALSDADGECCPFHRFAASGREGVFGGFGELAAHHAEVHAKAAEISARAIAGKTITGSDHESLMTLVLAFTASAQSVEREAWRVLATVDPLTGVGNRQTMMARLVAERDRSIRQKQPCCLALADIDHFKKVNDTYGHTQGDRVLRAVAGCVQGIVRPYDSVFRYGGEEFLICLPGADLATGKQILERIRASIAQVALVDDSGRTIRVTATFGLTTTGADLSVEEAVEQADNALYDGKRGGRNQVVVFGA